MNELNPQRSPEIQPRAASRTPGGPANQTRPGALADMEESKPTSSSGNKLPDQSATRPASAAAAEVNKAVVQLNDYVQSVQRDLHFRVDPDLGRPVVSVVDSNTQQVIRQIPSEVALNLARSLKASLGEGRDTGSVLNAADSQKGGTTELARSLQLINTRI